MVITSVEQWVEQAPPDVRKRLEFFDGGWHSKPMGGALHQDHCFLLTAELKRRGLRAFSDLIVHLPEVDPDRQKRVEVHPDVCVISSANPDPVGAGEYYGVPDFVIEVVSRVSDDRYDRIKRPVYERNGVRHYWLVRLTEPMTATPYRLEGGVYVEQPAVPLFPLEGLPIPGDL